MRWELQPRLCPGGRHVWLPEPKKRAEYSLCPRLTSVSSLESILGIPCFFCPPPPDEAEASYGPQKSPQSSQAAMVPTPESPAVSLTECRALGRGRQGSPSSTQNCSLLGVSCKRLKECLQGPCGECSESVQRKRDGWGRTMKAVAEQGRFDVHLER